LVVSCFGQNQYNFNRGSGQAMYYSAPIQTQRFGDLSFLPIKFPVMRANTDMHMIDIPIDEVPEQIITLDGLDKY